MHAGITRLILTIELQLSVHLIRKIGTFPIFRVNVVVLSKKVAYLFLKRKITFF